MRGWGGGSADIVLVLQVLEPEFRSPAPMNMLGVVAHTWDNGWGGQESGSWSLLASTNRLNDGLQVH